MKITKILLAIIITLTTAAIPIHAQKPVNVPKKSTSTSNTSSPKKKTSNTKASWKARAEAGDPKAMFEYGIRLSDYAERNKWVRKSADAGYGEAIWDVATTFWNDGDRKNSAIWYKKGADLGNGDCMISYAEALEKGDGVPVDKELALTYYKKGLRNAAYLGSREKAKEAIKRLSEQN